MQQIASHEKISASSLFLVIFEKCQENISWLLNFWGPPKTHKHTSQDATHHPHTSLNSLGAIFVSRQISCAELILHGALEQLQQ
jgi:hypothetical protein